MKQTMKEIETKIRKQIGEESKFVVLDKTKDGKIKNVAIGEWVKNSIVDELEQQADITKRELKKVEQDKEKDFLNYLKTNFFNIAQQIEHLSVMKAIVLIEIDLIKGEIEYPADYDKLIAWFKSYLKNEDVPIYESELLQIYIAKVRGK